MTTFDGKVAVVAGVASGVGRALAIGLARRGPSTAISDVNEEGLLTRLLSRAHARLVLSWERRIFD